MAKRVSTLGNLMIDVCGRGWTRVNAFNIASKELREWGSLRSYDGKVKSLEVNPFSIEVMGTGRSNI